MTDRDAETEYMQGRWRGEVEVRLDEVMVDVMMKAMEEEEKVKQAW